MTAVPAPKCECRAGRLAPVGHGTQCPEHPRYVRPSCLIIGSRVIVIPS